MPYIGYVPREFTAASLRTINRADAIITEYMAEGYVLTLRQLYYQFVARDLLPNSNREYKRLGRLMSDARLAGLIDWDAIEDRTRNLEELPHWDSPAAIVRSVAQQFRVDRWAGQPYRPEVWIEKEALAGVFQRVCTELDVPFFSCRGYGSQSEMWGAAQRMEAHTAAGQSPVVLHFGDHDPSGIDMSRDICDRLEVFGAAFHFHRLALNRDQVDRWNPPPNPAKVTDSRFQGYVVKHGPHSWELDALEPRVLAELAREAIMELVDPEPWEESAQAIADGRRLLRQAAGRWPEVCRMLEQSDDD